jgi:hypothetical protein
MENNGNRRLLIATGFVLFFVIIILIWYFFYAQPAIAPSLNGTNDPKPTRSFPPRFQFLTWGENTTSTTTTEVTDPLKNPLVEVWNRPSTGQTFITDQILKEMSETVSSGSTTLEVKKTIRATSSVLLFVDRITGYIYGYPVETGTVFQISNTVIPGVYDAYFIDNGNRVIIRYVDQEKNTVVGLIANVPHVEQTGSALPLLNVQYLTSQVMSVAVNKTKTKASYVVATEEGSAVYTIDTTKGTHLIASSPFREWSISYGGDTLYVTTKPSAYIEGGTFSLPLFQSEIVEKTGLMSLPHESGFILNSMWGSKGLATFFSDNGTIQVLPIKTLASKCAWGRKDFLICAIPRTIPKTTEGLPDDWFQGRISFSDDLALIDKNSGNRYTLYNFNEKEGVFDVVKISLSEANDVISFNKKQDGTLWLLNTNLIQGD